MDLARFPRRKYLEAPTPLHALPHFSKALGDPNFYIKRDDLLPGTEGGNKTRKLEFVVGDAIEKGADTLITCGAIQSNHCRKVWAEARLRIFEVRTARLIAFCTCVSWRW